MPTHWNGTVLLYSHGFGPPAAPGRARPEHPEPRCSRDGYAMAGSSYDPNGSWWALDSALNDQFQTLSAVEALLPPHRLVHVFAVGTSMGGLISSLEDEHSNGRLQASLTTCGIVAGGLQLNNYQLDGEYAISQLLNPTGREHPAGPLRPGSPGRRALTTGNNWTPSRTRRRRPPPGRARLALAMSLMNVATWARGSRCRRRTTTRRRRRDSTRCSSARPADRPTAIQTTQDFVEFGRPWIDQASGGSATWTKGVNFGLLLAESPYAPEVISLYRQAGLNLWSDLASLTRHANITADPAAVRSLTQTSVPTGRLQVPELDLHTISDQLVPVQQEDYYRHTVGSPVAVTCCARRSFNDSCTATSRRPSWSPACRPCSSGCRPGRWGDLADPSRVERGGRRDRAGQLRSAFIPFEPARLSGDNGPFDPFTGGSFPLPFGRW